jgi:chemotaxis protein methyltransferase CheR
LIETAETSQATSPSLDLSRRNFEKLARFVTGELGIKMGADKAAMVQSRLVRRVRELGLTSIDAYCDQLFTGNGIEEERIHIFNAITTNKTDFFREPQHFQFLTQVALPDIERNGHTHTDRRILAWSAPCSSGEEPYTLAMVLSQYAASRNLNYRILATDISTKVLRMAKEGIYTKQQVAPVPPELRRLYLLQPKTGDRSLVRVNAELRRSISFHQLNFMDTDYGVREMFSIIFCRNVLIYFDRPTQEAVVNKLCRNLRPGGYLFVSHSESLSGLDVPLTALGASCFKKPLN